MSLYCILKYNKTLAEKNVELGNCEKIGNVPGPADLPGGQIEAQEAKL
jgi:hypothetical protein